MQTSLEPGTPRARRRADAIGSHPPHSGRTPTPDEVRVMHLLWPARSLLGCLPPAAKERNGEWWYSCEPSPHFLLCPSWSLGSPSDLALIIEGLMTSPLRISTLSLIDPAFEPLHKAKVFTKLDLQNAYHLVRIREGDEWKTAFNTPLGHFEYLVMPFGSTNAPAVFQAMVNDVLRDMLNRFLFVYLDDLLIFSQSQEEHVQHVRQVLQRLLENKLYVKAEKCEFHVTSVSFLGFIIERGQVKADPAKIQAVADWPRPTTRKQLQRFLGFANFYRRFIRNYSKVAAPLTKLASVKAPFAWSPEAETAFLALKELFTSAPVLHHPDPSLQFVVEVDASDTGIGAVLSQRSPKDQKLHPCAFLSRRLSPAERNYDVGNRELLAVVVALQVWRHWLEGAALPFIVWTDHKNLAYLRSAKRLNSRQARWALFLDRFVFTLTYRPGSRNAKPDALSRQADPETPGTEPETILPASCVVAAVNWRIEALVKQAQRSQPDPGNGPPNRLFVPDSTRSQVLQWAHSSKISCHPGYQRTLDFLRRKFWWPSMARDTRAFVAACSVCAHGKSSHQLPAGQLHPLPVLSRPWSHIALDFVTGLPTSEGNDTILTIVDRFSKSVHFVPLPKLPSSLETAKLLVTHVFRLHGIPQDLVSDRGPQFASQVWRAFCQALGASVSLSSGYHPQSNGQTERANQQLEAALRCVVARHPVSWCTFLPWIEYAHNSSPALPQVCPRSWQLMVFNLHCSHLRKGRWRSRQYRITCAAVAGFGLRLVQPCYGQRLETNAWRTATDSLPPITLLVRRYGCLLETCHCR
uniref:Gypsy retrotransposon integrase-like protein 1 n=1 Tax=Dicentrarchus labrax TaxID=13489 RepID=A0A8P4FYW6_DICLA